MGGAHHAGAARQQRLAGAGAVVDRGADGQVVRARHLRGVVGADRHGARARALPHCGADADRDHAGERAAVSRGGRALCPAHRGRARRGAAGGGLSRRGGRARSLCATCAGLHLRRRGEEQGMTTTRRTVIGGTAASGAAAILRAFAAAAPATYPSQTIRVIVPFAPGGGADLVARLLAQHFLALLGQPAVVENRAGAAGRVGTALVAKSAPDGYTLLVTTESSLVIAPHIGVPLGYDPLRDFAPVSLLTRNTIVLAVNPAMPARTLEEYIDLARAHPGEVLFASSGVGGPNHLAGETFNRLTGLKITHVPYAGTGLALQAVIANQVGSMWGFTAGGARQVGRAHVW